MDHKSWMMKCTSSIFFDYNINLIGDVSLAERIIATQFLKPPKKYQFSLHLASGRFQNPSPTGFFRQLLVEETGTLKMSFDVKRKGH